VTAVVTEFIGMKKFLSAKYKRNCGSSPKTRLMPILSINSRSSFFGKIAKLTAIPEMNTSKIVTTVAQITVNNSMFLFIIKID